ncbi:hypothetical protein AB6A40_000440 [Gnathostoma spinigerum]|uniref:Uncharacterized protein n=1 Tax=Gnathostoma spinigerum TaxID=75299 RepID=A0ABD6E3C2_9BILA
MATPQISIGHPSFSAFKPYFRPAVSAGATVGQPNICSSNQQRGTVEISTIGMPSQQASNTIGPSRRRQRTTFTPSQSETLEKRIIDGNYVCDKSLWFH